MADPFTYQLGRFHLFSPLTLPLPEAEGSASQILLTGSVSEEDAGFDMDIAGRVIWFRGSASEVGDRLIDEVLPRFLAGMGELVLHGSAVLLNGEAILLCGRSGSGKSTLAQALASRGHSAVADDFVPYVSSDHIAAGALAARFRGDSFATLGLHSARTTATGKFVVQRDRIVPPRSRLARIFFLEPAVVSQPRIEEVPRDRAFALLMESRYLFDARSDLELNRHLDLATVVAGTIPIANLIYPHQFAALAETVSVIEEAAVTQCV